MFDLIGYGLLYDGFGWTAVFAVVVCFGCLDLFWCYVWLLLSARFLIWVWVFMFGYVFASIRFVCEFSLRLGGCYVVAVLAGYWFCYYVLLCWWVVVAIAWRLVACFWFVSSLLNGLLWCFVLVLLVCLVLFFCLVGL